MKIALCGYSGKTGREVYELLLENNYEVIGIDEDSKPLQEVIKNIDLVIDFTNVSASLKHINLCIENNKPFIVGTTGFSSDELAKIKSQCNMKNIRGVICYNFALPINYILHNFDFFKQYFNDMTYTDVHHISKKDKKSGTTYLFLLKDKRFKIKTIKTSQKTITYIIEMKTTNDKMIISYQVYAKRAFAIGLCDFLKTKDESKIINLIG